MQNTEETIAKYAVDANLFRLESTNPQKKIPAPGFFVAFIQGAYCRVAFVRVAFFRLHLVEGLLT